MAQRGFNTRVAAPRLACSGTAIASRRPHVAAKTRTAGTLMSVKKKGPRGRPKVTATQEFVKRMTSWEGISDGSLSARIVGEFSAGKTRLLSAVLGGIVPEALTPVSSRDVQTRLPLEVTYGDEPLLTVVEYAQGRDLGAKILRELDQFPAREQIVEMALDPDLHRLRLSLPLAQLVLPNGDFFDDRKTPK